MFNNMSLREKFIIFIGLILVIIALYYFYIYLPLNEEVNSLENTLKQKENTITTLERITGDYESLENKYEDLQEELAEEEKQEEIREKYKITTSDLLKYFNQKTDEANIVMNNFNPNEDDQKVEISFSYNGDFYESLNFFDLVANFQEVIGYETLNINNQGEELSTSMKVIFPKRVETGDEND